MAFPYRHVLLIGASSGIGHAMAERLIENGTRVIVVGRRNDRLQDFIRKYGNEKVTPVSFDISKRNEIPQFVNKVVTAHPDLDCIFLNAGVQSRIDFTQPSKLNVADFLSEMDVNFSSFVALTYGFIPFLMAKNSPASLIYTGSNLAIVPAPYLPAYSASKAALNSFVLCLREQLRNSSLKVIELSPPVVQTELHDKTMGAEAGRKLGMPMNEFIDQAFKGFLSGSDQIVIGSVGPADVFNDIICKRRTACENLAALMREGKVPGRE